ncbi:ATP-binding protein [Streptomyces arenae]|uniref:ATP-binding protein n=1 Tax=Streptomyces arenae TaxID=29301 RepID=UPI00265B3F6F|nr:ATP-binding protein [Streptomyces arenae]MCG7208276.1 ATP-binding protein [Streptomyces arenae]
MAEGPEQEAEDGPQASRSSLRAVGWARSLPASSGVKAARDWTRGHLATLGWTRTAPDLVDSVLLTVSELVTNAHVHAHSTAQLILVWDEECLHVTVHDTSSYLPEQRRPDDEAQGGRGMLLVDALADTWQAQRCPRGKDVIACFRPPSGATAG